MSRLNVLDVASVTDDAEEMSSTKYYESLSLFVRTLMEQRRLDTAGLALQSGIPESRLDRIRRGRVVSLKTGEREALAKALEVDTLELLNREDRPGAHRLAAMIKFRD